MKGLNNRLLVNTLLFVIRHWEVLEVGLRLFVTQYQK
jgi:hypothetical protein